HYVTPYFVSGYTYRLLVHSFPTRRSSDLALVSSNGDSYFELEALSNPLLFKTSCPLTYLGSVTKTTSASVFGNFNPASSIVSGSDRKSTRLNSSHVKISYAVFCLKIKLTT